MKNIFYLVFVAVLTFGCTADNEPIDPTFLTGNTGGGNTGGGNTGGGNGTGGGNPTAIFMADLDGVTFTATAIEANVNEDGLLIKATEGIQELGFQVFSPATGTFSVNQDSTADGLMIYDDNNTNENTAFIANTGSINISQYDTTTMLVGGTFSGNLQELFGSAPDVVVTNGIFSNVPYTTMGPTDMATASINGTAFNANLFPVAEVNNVTTVVFDNDLDQRISLIFPSDIMVGSYPMEAQLGTYYGTYINDSVNGGATHFSQAGVGQIEVTNRMGNVVTGTFEFTAVDPADATSVFTITNGDFVIELL